MRRVLTWLLTVFLAIAFSPFLQTAYAANSTAFGPSSWTMYRGNPQDNPVYNTGSANIKATMRIFKTDNQIRATPVVAGNSLYIGNHLTGTLNSFNLKTGKLNWQNKAPNWVHSAMDYYQGQIFVGYGNRNFQQNGLRGTGKSGVLSLNAQTGKILWDFPTSGEVMPTPVVYQGNVYVVTGGKHLYELNRSTGKVEWQLALGSYVSMSSPVVSNGVLYFGGANAYQFFAVNLKQRTILWKHPFPHVSAGMDDVPPAVSDNIVVTTGLLPVPGSETEVTHEIYAMNAETGQLIWQEKLGSGSLVSNNKSGAPMIYNGKVFVGSPITKTFYALDLKTGKRLWTFNSGMMKAPPVADNGIVYFSNAQGNVYALKTKTGKELGTKHIGGVLAPAGPIIINHYLIIGSQDHNVYMMPTYEISGVKQKPAPQPQSASAKLPNSPVRTAGFSKAAVLSIAVGGLILISLLTWVWRYRRSR
ncbi:PQQ-binding-like beta-propeller repeat protein [Alicyclobacillus sp. SO9]|uniref:outer membrane protein assembly factor BamB family protein n=1 Tax=Alicyclobacillus sp. SO9 TaxID=2665646 RepID=UPI0018E75B8D|nr:PQQ-binding-like beta-propeller repeat protein [Alicyclobacillus sp. SO9]QQE76888.1 PQQ-binding-like beta-propeller repeat protein [Alicyclobacillus sp. SO9]